MQETKKRIIPLFPSIFMNKNTSNLEQTDLGLY